MTTNVEEPAPAKREPFASSTNEDEQGERCGTVAVERRVKDDGRALLVYSHIAGQGGGE